MLTGFHRWSQGSRVCNGSLTHKEFTVLVSVFTENHDGRLTDGLLVRINEEFVFGMFYGFSHQLCWWIQRWVNMAQRFKHQSKVNVSFQHHHFFRQTTVEKTSDSDELHTLRINVAPFMFVSVIMTELLGCRCRFRPVPVSSHVVQAALHHELSSSSVLSSSQQLLLPLLFAPVSTLCRGQKPV